MKNVITIDGPVAAGKTKVCKEVARILGFHNLDTGIFYRIVALIWKDGFDPSRITYEDSVVCLDGNPVEEKLIRNPTIDELTPKYAAMPHVRKALIPVQQSCAMGKGLVVGGRDMGSVVFPDAKLKVYLTASPLTRAIRRRSEYVARGPYVSIDQVLRELNERDRRDMVRTDSPLLMTSDMVEISSDSMEVEEVAQMIVALWKTRNCTRM